MTSLRGSEAEFIAVSSRRYTTRTGKSAATYRTAAEGSGCERACRWRAAEKRIRSPPRARLQNIGSQRQGQSPQAPEDQSQEQDGHPLTYDYNRQGAIIVVHC